MLLSNEKSTYRSGCLSSNERIVPLPLFHEHSKTSRTFNMVLDVSVSDSYGNSDYDELEATLRLSASLVRELVVGRRVPDPRKNYNRKFSEIVAVFNSLTSTGASAKAANNACANCGTRHADEVCTSDGNAPVAEGIRIVSALKSLFRRRRLCVDFATK